MDLRTVIAGSFLALAIPLAEAATIYKTVDNNGNVVFTDTQPTDQPGEPVNLRPLTSIPALPTRRPMPVSTTKPTRQLYSRLTITKPDHNATIRDQETITVNIAISPRVLFSHSVRLRLNGKVVAESRRQSTFELKEVERGRHTLTAEIVDSQQQVIRSTSHTIFVHRTVFTPDFSINPPEAITRPDAGIQPVR